MSDVEQLFWVLVALYAWMSAVWLPPRAMLLVSHFGETHRLLSIAGSALLRNDHGGVLFANLTPLGSSVVADPWPVALSPDGILSFCPASGLTVDYGDAKSRYLPWPEVKQVAASGRIVLINNKDFVTCATGGAALRIADLVTRCHDAQSGEREKLIGEAVRESLNVSAVTEKYLRTVKGTIVLRLVSALLMLFLFGVPGITAFTPRKFDLLSCLGIYFVLLVLVAVIDFFTQRRLLPKESRRGANTWMLLVSPADAIRAADACFRGALGGYHPLALGLALCRKEPTLMLAREILADLQHPVRWSASEDGRATGEWFRKLLCEETEAALKSAGYEVDQILPPIVRDSEKCQAYCPRCRGQYEIACGACGTCGLPLVLFAAHESTGISE